jgi:hypothetical protein
MTFTLKFASSTRPSRSNTCSWFVARVQLRVVRVVRGVEAAEGQDSMQGEVEEEEECVAEGEAGRARGRAGCWTRGAGARGGFGAARRGSCYAELG